MEGQPMITQIEWIHVAVEKPDEEILLLLAFSDGSVSTGFLEWGVWRHQDASRALKPPVWWAHLPASPEVKL
jgi:hypothetical protein